MTSIRAFFYDPSDIVGVTFPHGVRQIGTRNTPTGQVDDGLLSGFGFGRNTRSPGAWVVPDAGSTLSLMTVTLIAFGVVARRFKRAAG